MGLSTDDRLEIRELLERQNFGLDRASEVFGQGGTEDEYFRVWLDTFTEDGSFEYPEGRWEGQQGLREWWYESGARRPWVRHWINSIVIDGDESGAVAHCYLTLIEVEPAPTVLLTGRYEDTLRKVDGRWKIAQRLVFRDGTQPLPPRPPGEQAPAR